MNGALFSLWVEAVATFLYDGYQFAAHLSSLPDCELLEGRLVSRSIRSDCI